MIATPSTTRQYCTFRLAHYHCGIAVESVHEILNRHDMTHVPLAPSIVAGLINLRGQILIAMDLRARMGFPKRDADRQPVIIVVEDGEADVCTALLVDEIGDVIEVDPGDCESPPPAIDAHHRELIQQVCKRDQGLLMILHAGNTTQF